MELTCRACCDCCLAGVTPSVVGAWGVVRTALGVPAQVGIVFSNQ